MVTVLHVGSKAVAIDQNTKLSQELERCDVNGDSHVDVYEAEGSWWEKVMQLRDDPARGGRNRSCIAQAFSKAGVLSSAQPHHDMQGIAIEYFLEVAPQVDQLTATVKDFRANNTNGNVNTDDDYLGRNFKPEYYFDTVVPQIKKWAAEDQVGDVARLFQGMVRYFKGDAQASQAEAQSSESAVEWAKARARRGSASVARSAMDLTEEQVPALLLGSLQEYANDLSSSLLWLTIRSRYQCERDQYGDRQCFANHVKITEIY